MNLLTHTDEIEPRALDLVEFGRGPPRRPNARVKYNAFLRDMNLGVRAGQDLPCFNGAQLAVDVTFRSALCGSGEPQPGAAEVDGAVLFQARATTNVGTMHRHAET